MDEAAPLHEAATPGEGPNDPQELDLRGLKCPLPVLRTRKALRRLAVGQALRVLCTDPLATLDIPNLVREDGHRLEAAGRADGVAIFVIVKQNGRPPA